MINLAAIPPTFQAIYFFFAFESPRYLLKIGDEKNALKSLKGLRGNDALTLIEFEQIKIHLEEANKNNEQIKSAGVFDVIKQLKSNFSLRRAVILGKMQISFKLIINFYPIFSLNLGCTLQLVQQLAGINTIMYYSATIIEQGKFCELIYSN